MMMMIYHLKRQQSLQYVRVLYVTGIIANTSSNRYLRTSLKVYIQLVLYVVYVDRGWYMLAVEFTIFVKRSSGSESREVVFTFRKSEPVEVGLTEIRYGDRTLQRETRLSHRQVPSISKRLLQPSSPTFSSIDSTRNTMVTMYRMH
jgi:hypothetical protein